MLRNHKQTISANSRISRSNADFPSAKTLVHTVRQDFTVDKPFYNLKKWIETVVKIYQDSTKKAVMKICAAGSL